MWLRIVLVLALIFEFSIGDNTVAKVGKEQLACNT